MKITEVQLVIILLTILVIFLCCLFIVANWQRLNQETATTTTAICDCEYDLFNCDSFRGDQSMAQACYEYCLSVGQGDVHRLDVNKNNKACDP